MTGMEIPLMIASIAVATTGAVVSMQQQARINRYNAEVARRKAVAERERATFEAARIRKKGRKLEARQLVATAKSGTQLVGSPLAVMAESAGEIELEAELAEREGLLAEQEALSQAELDEMKARAATTKGYLDVGTTLLTGASKYKTYKTSQKQSEFYKVKRYAYGDWLEGK